MTQEGTNPTRDREPAVWAREIPQRNYYFTGRTEVLDRLHESLTGAGGWLALHALNGSAGIGKTQLAVEYAHRFRHEYDLIWWISAYDPKLIRASLTALAEALDLGLSGANLAVPAVLDALRQGRPYRRWLLIFDNADSPETLNDFLPSGPGHVLITSRDRRWTGACPTIDLSVFKRSESIAYLTRRVDGLSENDADRLAEALGDLPIALVQAASFQLESGISTDDYLEALKRGGPQEVADAPPLDYPMPLHNMWTLSIETVRSHNPDAIELLDRCAFFGPAPIPLSVFTETAQVVDSDFQELLAAPMRLKRALGVLNRYSLADVDTIHNTVQIHRLMQAFRRHALADRADSIRHEVHLLISAAAPHDQELGARPEIYASLLAHVDDSKVVGCRTEAARRFCIGLVRHLYMEGDYHSARQYSQLALDHWRATIDPDDLYLLTMSRLQGMTMRLLGDVRGAYEINSRTLQRMQEILGKDHEETLAAMNDHGGDLRALGRFQEARELDEESYRIHREVFGEHTVKTLRAANNLALDHRLAAAYHEALRLDREILERRLALHGRADHPMVLASRNQVARDLRECGQYAESAALQREVYRTYRAVTNDNHPFALRAQKNLSVSLRKDGHLAESRPLAEDVYQRYLNLFGADHIDTLASRCNLINELRLAGELDEAHDIGVDTLERYRRTLGEEHPITLGCAINVAIVLRLRGAPQQARELSQEAHEGLCRLVGPDHHYTLSAAVGLAGDLAACTHLGEACRLGEETLQRWRAAPAFGPDHPYTLSCAMNLSQDLRALGEEKQAATLAEETIERLRAKLRPGHPLIEQAVRGERLECDFEPPPL